jgi:hypothetical protein
MSVQVDKAHVQEYNSGFQHLSQQMEARLQGKYRAETQNSEIQFWDQIGEVTAVKRTVRHGDTPQIDTPHERRANTMEDYDWGDMIDSQDKLRMVTDPSSDYLKAAVFSLKRFEDLEVIRAHSDTAYTGKKGGTAKDLAAANILVATDGAGTSPVTPTYMNELTLRRIAEYFAENESNPLGSPVYLAINAANLYQGLLADEKIISSDYAAIKALVNGEINTFMGIEFCRTELLSNVDVLDSRYNGSAVFDKSSGAVETGSDTFSNADLSCKAWVQDGVLLATGENIVTRLGEDPTKGFNVRAYAKMSIGGTRMEEKKVLEVITKK